ncbi:MAG: pyrroloquinoline quinone-dependent dehydrogenase [Myxococcales bacterium]|nr:pyrroloquinoline quinone-dependent dehydrogenase [Myxococcales bacterium]
MMPVARSAALALGAAALAACSNAPELDFSGPTAGWEAYGSSPGGGRYSPLTQITAENVGDLEIAWVYHTGDYEDGTNALGPSSFQVTPIVIDDTMYLCTSTNRVIALDSETGEERWTFDPVVDTSMIYTQNCRGVSVWTDPEAPASAACRMRILTATLDARLIALDAVTGLPCPEFGKAGTVDLADGIGERDPGEYGVTSPPAIVDDLVVTGSMVLDNRRIDSPGGVVRAYDARSGALRWSWDPVPPDTPALRDAPPDVRYRRGTANVWSPLAVDRERMLVFAPTGNTSPDYYGGERYGLDYYSSSVVALDARNGEVQWHFQTVHHDVWDYDVPSQPTLLDFPDRNGSIPAIAQTTKVGTVFFLDRRTGEPIFPVEERPVPQGAAPGDVLSPTQPYPVAPPPIHPQEPLRPEDAFGFTPWDRAKCRDAIAELRSDGAFTPPSIQGTLQYPGMVGGANWGSPAIDPERGIMVINTMRVATRIRLIPRAGWTEEMDTAQYGFEPQRGSPYGLERIPLMSPFGAPCNPPPWGTLVAIDIAKGEILWDVPLGSTRDLAPFPLWFDMGVPNKGGPMVTASGLIFIAATSDDFLRAFHTETGEELWKGRLPAGGQAGVMSYRVRRDGRQYLAIAAGGHGLLGTNGGDSLVAFALP